MNGLIRKRFGWAVMLCMTLALLLCPVDSDALKLEESSKGGKVVRKEWKDESGETVNGPEGYAVILLSYKDTTVIEKYYTADDRVFTTAGGYAGRELTYGNKHRLTEVVYFDENGDRVNSAAGFARVKISYTAKGQVTAASFFDADNRAVVPRGWNYASVKCDYRGTTMTSKTWLDGNKNPVDQPAGYAAYIQSVNKRNNITKIDYQHSDGTPALCASGWSTLDYELDKKERIIGLTYFDENGDETTGNMGYSKEKRAYESNRVYTVERETPMGEIVPFGPGIEMIRIEKDSDDRVIRESYFDIGGAPVPNPEGAVAVSYIYDQSGRMTGLVLEDENGSQTMGNDGWSACMDTLNEQGFITGRVYLDNDGKKVNLPQGYCEIRYVYDECGIETGKQYYSADGTTVRP